MRRDYVLDPAKICATFQRTVARHIGAVTTILNTLILNAICPIDSCAVFKSW